MLRAFVQRHVSRLVINRPNARVGASARALLALGLVPAALLPSSGAQTCTPTFATGFEASGVMGQIYASIEYDAQDGNGPRLYVAGQFARAGGRLCNSIAMFDGTNFVPLGGGLPQNGLPTSGPAIVYDLEVFDPDGPGPMKPELWAAGYFSRARQTDGSTINVASIARWNGSTRTWSSVETVGGGAPEVFDLMADNQLTGPNAGPRMYVTHSAGPSVGESAYITYYRWDGSNMVRRDLFAIGAAPLQEYEIVWRCCKYNGRVYFGGAFPEGVRRITEDGAGYETLPANPAMAYENAINNPGSPAAMVAGMVVWNDRLLIGPAETSLPMESFDGTAWRQETFGPLGGSNNTVCGNMAVIDLGTGPKLYFGDKAKNGYGFNGAYDFVQGPLPEQFTGAAVWDGTTLAPLGQGFQDLYGGRIAGANTFTKTTLRGQPVVFVGGSCGAGRNAANALVRGRGGLFYSGTSWVPQYNRPVNEGRAGQAVMSIDGVNQRIVSSSDPANPGTIQLYDGTSWAASNIPSATAVAGPSYIRYNSGSADVLIAYGQEVDADRVNDRPAKIQVQQWDPATQTWVYISALANLPGSTGPGLPAGIPRSATVFDIDGPGPRSPWLVIGGNASPDDFIAAPPNIVAYDGVNWFPVGSGLPDTPGDSAVWSVVAFNDGSSTKLYASGTFLDPAGAVARYDGTDASGTWTIIGRSTDTFNGYLNKLKVLDVGAGPQLFASGAFSDMFTAAPGTTPTGPIARWTGSSWASVRASPLAKIYSTSPFAALISDIAAFDDGTGPALFATGPFGGIGGVAAAGLAKFNGASWSPIGAGLNSYVFSSGNVPDNLRMNSEALLVFDEDGSGPSRPALYISGGFDNANGTYAERFVRYGCPRVVCRADFNGSGSVTVQDIFDFLAAWFSNSPSADFNSSGSVTVQDIFDFIGAWFQGCA